MMDTMWGKDSAVIEPMTSADMYSRPRPTSASLFILLWTILIALLLCPATSWADGTDLGPEDVLLVVNNNSPISKSVAYEYRRHYPQITEEQVVYLTGLPDAAAYFSTPANEIITRQQFENQIAQPIRNHLIATGLVDDIYCIITTAGMPYRIGDTTYANVVMPAASNPIQTLDNRNKVDAASVESELSVLWQIDPALDAARRAPTANRLVNPYQGYCSDIRNWAGQRDMRNRRNNFNWSSSTLWRVDKHPQVEGEYDIFKYGLCGFSGLSRQMSPADIYLVARLDGPRGQGKYPQPLFAIVDMLERAADASSDAVGYNPSQAMVVIDDNNPNAGYNYAYSKVLNFPPQYNWLNCSTQTTPPGAEEFTGGLFNEANHYKRAFQWLTGTTEEPGGLLTIHTFQHGLGGTVIWDGTNVVMNQNFLNGSQKLISLQTYGRNGADGRSAHYLTTLGPDGGPLFECAPGAIFTSLESFNAVTMFTDVETGQGKIAEFIEIGGTAAVGHAFEPEVSALPQNDFLLCNLLRDENDDGIGDLTLVEAVYSALPYLSWAEVMIGDPLMRFHEGPGDTVLLETIPEDTNRDGIVTIKDLSRVKPLMAKHIGQPGYVPQADVNRDGYINFEDISRIKARLLE